MIIKDRLQYIIILTAIFIIAFTSSISADIYDISTLNYEEKLSYDEYLELYKDYNRPEQEIVYLLWIIKKQIWKLKLFKIGRKESSCYKS